VSQVLGLGAVVPNRVVRKGLNEKVMLEPNLESLNLDA
jgi:hypothetical protein